MLTYQQRRAALMALNDRDLVTRIKTTTNKEEEKEARLVLYQRYERFVHKHWHSLSSRMNRSAAVLEMKSDFYAESYMVFEKALKAVKLSKIKNSKWKFLGYFGFYLSTLKNNFAKNVVHLYHNETALEIPTTASSRCVILSDMSEAGIVRSAEEEIIERDERERFWKALTQCKSTVWDSTQKAIWDKRAAGVSIKETCQELEISAWKFNKLLSEMKTQLQTAITHS